jgi:hypothetical protein
MKYDCGQQTGTHDSPILRSLYFKQMTQRDTNINKTLKTSNTTNQTDKGAFIIFVALRQLG